MRFRLNTALSLEDVPVYETAEFEEHELRDFFAAQVSVALHYRGADPAQAARMAYGFADEMLKARKARTA